MGRWIFGRKGATSTTTADVSRMCTHFLKIYFSFYFPTVIHVHASTYGFLSIVNPLSIIRTSEEDIINPIQSARMRTINSFSFTYGTVEIRAKMPRGDWIWPGMFSTFRVASLVYKNHTIVLFIFFFSELSHVDDANWKSFRSMATLWRNRHCRNSSQ